MTANLYIHVGMVFFSETTSLVSNIKSTSFSLKYIFKFLHVLFS